MVEMAMYGRDGCVREEMAVVREEMAVSGRRWL